MGLLRLAAHSNQMPAPGATAGRGGRSGAGPRGAWAAPRLAATLLLATLGASNVAADPRAADSGTASPAPRLPAPVAATSLLVVAPHPDDETLCCAGLMQRVLQAGGRVAVVWITSGDGSEVDLLVIERSLLRSPERARDLAGRRMREARAAATRLGVAPAGQLFLGYPDRGLLEVLTRHRTQPYTSPFNGASAVPYAETLSPGHPYTGESLERDFAAVLERTRPTLILAPTPLDSHPDHRAAGLLTIAAAARGGLQASVRYWIVHGGEGWPSPRGLLAGIPLTPAPRIRGLSPEVFALEPAEEDGKLGALRAYETQMRTLAPFLLAFVRTTELFTLRAEP
jgi:LmbE family N-acetylglucosaminyl deacetylase